MSKRKTLLTIKANEEYLSSLTTLEHLDFASIREDNNELLSLPTTLTISDLPVNSDDITETCQLKE